MDLLLLAAEQADVTDFTPVVFITALVVFLIVLFIAARFIWPPIMKGLDEREAKIRQEIRQAEEAREQAKRLLSDYERNLQAAREEANKMIAKARADSKVLAEELRKRNEEELTDLKQRATAEIEAAKQTAIAEIYAEAGHLATSMAAKILQRELTAEDQQRLVEESLDEMATARGA